MTNNWVDIKNADVVLVMGGNPAEAHPCGFKWVIEAKVKNRARLVVVDPRFTRTAAVADVFAQLRPGTAEWKRVSWDWALDRIAHLMKEDRDKNFIQKNAAGLTVNRWTTVAFLAASASSNESGYITNKIIRAMGMTALDNQARV